MPRRCFVPACRSNYKGEPYTNIFSFPKDPDLRAKWERSINRKDFVVTKSSVVCMKHFEERFIERYQHGRRDDGTTLSLPRRSPVLKADALPTIFSEYPTYMSTSSMKLLTTRKKSASGSKKMNNELEVIKSAVNGLLFAKNGYLYEKERIIHSPKGSAVKTVYVRCSKNRRDHCKARMVLRQDGDSYSVKKLCKDPHNHLPMIQEINERKLKNKMKNSVKKNPTRPVKHTYTEVVLDTLKSDASAEMLMSVPSYKGVSSFLYRERAKQLSSNSKHSSVSNEDLAQEENNAIYNLTNFSMEPEVVIKEEPSDYDENNSSLSCATDSMTVKEEFILPNIESELPSTATSLPSTSKCTSSENSPLTTVAEFSIKIEPQECEDSFAEFLAIKMKQKKGTSETNFVADINEELHHENEVVVSDVVPNNETKELIEQQKPRDEFDLFGEFIATKLRQMEWKKRTFLQKAIGDLVYETEIGNLGEQKSAIGSEVDC